MIRFFQVFSLVLVTSTFSMAFAAELTSDGAADLAAKLEPKLEAKIAYVTCAGKALDGTAIELKFCYKEPSRVTYTATRKSCDKSVVTSFDGRSEEYGSPKRILIAEGLYVGLETLNDGLETHSSITFSAEERERAWNTMKISSVTTGKKYLVTDFTCSIAKQP